MLRALTLILLPSALLVPAAPAAAQAAKGKKYALLVGVTEYKHSGFPALKYTENDVEGLAALLRRSTAGFELRVLTTGRGKKQKKDAPTAANILAALEDLVADKGKDDIVLVALAGHGMQLEVKDPDGEKRPARTFSFFCPANADLTGVSYSTGRSKTLINMDDLFAALAKCGAGTKLMLIDACRNELKATSSTRNIDVRAMNVPEGVGALFSCKSGERAWETDKLGRGHGVFFYHVLEALKGEARDRDGEVTWDGMSTYVRKRVSPWIEKQIGGGATQTPHEVKSTIGASPVLVRGLAKVATNDRPPADKGKTPVVDSGKLFRKGLAHVEGRGERYAPADAARSFRQAADAGHDLSKAALAYLLARGNGVRRDEEEAQRLGKQSFAFVKAAAEKEKADGDVQAILGRLYLAGLGTSRDEAQALEWFKKGAGNGSSLAMVELGRLLTIGRPGRKADEAQAFGWFKRAADRGNADALFLVGQFQAEGRGGQKRNVKLAMVALKRAADANHRDAKELLRKLER